MSAPFTMGVYLPPGPLPTTLVRKVLELMMNQYGWLRPAKYQGFGSNEGPINPGDPFMEKVLATYAEDDLVMLIGKSERHGATVSPWIGYGGYVKCWWPSAAIARKPKWRDAQIEHVVELMRLLDSHLAYADVEARRKINWVWKGKWGSTGDFLHDYSKGLAGIFWRTFLGAPFVRLFGEKKLASLPVGTSRKLDDDLWLIEPYPMPLDGLTEEGKARERAIIEYLGKECFFDHERHISASRFADLPYIDVDALLDAEAQRRLEQEHGKGSREVAVGMKIREFRTWEKHHWDDGPVHLISDVGQWALDHSNDPDFLQSDPGKVFEMLRARIEEEERSPKPPPPAPSTEPTEAAQAVQKTLGSDLVQVLLHLGEVARDIEQAGLDELPPEQQDQVRGVKALADLAKSRRPSKSPRRKKP